MTKEEEEGAAQRLMPKRAGNICKRSQRQTERRRAQRDRRTAGKGRKGEGEGERGERAPENFAQKTVRERAREREEGGGGVEELKFLAWRCSC